MRCSKCEEEEPDGAWYKKGKIHKNDEVKDPKEWLCQSCYDNLPEKEKDSWRRIMELGEARDAS